MVPNSAAFKPVKKGYSFRAIFPSSARSVLPKELLHLELRGFGDVTPPKRHRGAFLGLCQSGQVTALAYCFPWHLLPIN